jgi:MFS family permease
MRAFQGIGGGGLYTMVFVILPDMVTSKQYPLYATVLSSVFALSNLLGPIIGGLINNHTSWRWIFYLK